MNWPQKYGEWALVTGASSGIGRAFALDLARQGMNIILVARRLEKLNLVAAECEKLNVNTHICLADLTQSNAVDEVESQVMGKEVGILINNAGIVARGQFCEVDLQRQLDMVALNCTAPVALTHCFLKSMLTRNKGAVITLSSIIAYYFQPFLATYAATKEFDLRFAKSLFWELKGTGIETLTVIPGFTKTGAYEAADWLIDFAALPALFKPQDSQRVSKLALKALGRKRSIIIASPMENFILNLSYFLPDHMVESILGKLFT